ncbi:ATP-binding protein [Streptomyces sp. NPDC101733]|uniref:ATP-binding protein n=1 Tax=unclassified Streptomyces TaxID=2593676 RepID=UPI0037F8FBA3
MPAQLIDISLPGTLQAAGQARRALGACVTDRAMSDDGQLLLSEAVANAVEHTDSDRLRLVIRYEAETGTLMCALHDEGADFRSPTASDAPNDTAESGRGLAITAALSTRWGFSTDGFGKWLWFSLSATT